MPFQAKSADVFQYLSVQLAKHRRTGAGAVGQVGQQLEPAAEVGPSPLGLKTHQLKHSNNDSADTDLVMKKIIFLAAFFVFIT